MAAGQAHHQLAQHLAAVLDLETRLHAAHRQVARHEVGVRAGAVGDHPLAHLRQQGTDGGVVEAEHAAPKNGTRFMNSR